MPPLQVEVVTAEGRIFSGETDSVTAPGAEGQLTILPSHAPLITSLTDGELKLMENGSEHFIALLGGFMEVNNNQVTILANAAEDESKIDLERAETAMRRAQDRHAWSGSRRRACPGRTAQGARKGHRGPPPP